ncbi:putative F-box protein At1g50870 [Ananas comosus]|uniref:F-box protein At1g50870 n=1 Tax=Ananas comosus TaxID=4615 RepID=A0A6P5H2N7_ANACO|nr:putative F-box protein At1g50870 [Ananas comosus]
MKNARWPCISDDLIAYRILPCLPTKDLVRLQCVSKSWRSLILNDPYFARLQVAHARSRPALLVITDKPEPSLYTADPNSVGFPKLCKQFDDQRYWHPPKIMASCKGIICVSLVSLSWDRMLLYVGNPVLNNWILLPPPFDDDPIVSIGLAVNEMESGVGYKLAVPFRRYDSDELVMEVSFKVLASAKGSWEISKEKVLTYSSPFWSFRYVTNVEGTLFWEHHEKAIWFDAKEERCGTLSLPSQFKYCKHRLGEWNGHLSFMTTENGEISIWSWNKSCWSKKLLLTIEAVARENFHFFASLGLRMNLRNRKSESLEAILRRSTVDILTFAANFIIFEVNEKRICYDAITGKAWRISKNSINRKSGLSYVNSLLKLTNTRVAE